MDFQHRAGSKTGGGGVAGWSESNRDRKERLRTLALETIDLNKVRTYWSVPPNNVMRTHKDRRSCTYGPRAQCNKK